MDNRKFIEIKHTYTSRSDARQQLKELKRNGKILDYIISWDTQLRMIVRVCYPNN